MLINLGISESINEIEMLSRGNVASLEMKP